MAQRSATLGLLLLSALVACDTAGDPLPSSTFPAQDFRAHDVFGILRRGEDGVQGAAVHVGPSSAPDTFTTSVATDAVGFYRATGAISWLYDLSFVLPGGSDGRTDVFVVRSLASRYYEPQFELSGRVLPRAWTGHVQVHLEKPLETGHTLLFLASGDGVYGVTGDLENGLDVHTSRYEQSANIRAVEYDPAKGLVSASAYGKADVIVAGSRPASVTLHLDPFTDSAEPGFTIDLPPGFVPGSVDIRFNSSRTSDALMISIPWGQAAKLPVVPDQGYTYQLRAMRADGAVSDSGEQNFDVRSKDTHISLPAPPDVFLPADGATIEKGQTISAVGTGVIEHLFEPQAPGAPSLRIVGTSRDTTLPDLTALAVDKGIGPYTWTVRRFPNVPAVENLSGTDARRYRPMAISAPRALVLR